MSMPPEIPRVSLKEFQEFMLSLNNRDAAIVELVITGAVAKCVTSQLNISIEEMLSVVVHVYRTEKGDNKRESEIDILRRMFGADSDPESDTH